MHLNASVIVTTYNKPQELNLVLYGLHLQKSHPNEIIIADDGSNQETKDVILKWKSKFNLPLMHIWHEDKGNRKLTICNKAANSANGDYLIFLDGDSIPHSLWVHDHLKSAKTNTVLCGRRVRLGPDISKLIDQDFIESGKLKLLSKSILSSIFNKDTKRAILGIRLPKALARCFHPAEKRLMGVNFSLHKNLFEKVGGYTETINKNFTSKENVREDAQLEIELLKAGAARYPLINRGIVYHLYHQERPVNKLVDAKILEQYNAALQRRKKLMK